MDANELKRILDVHEIMARAYADDRLSRRVGICDMRAFVIASAWVFTIERPKVNYWVRVAELVSMRPDSLWLVFREDAPRFEPTRLPQHQCEATVLRRGTPGPCGRRGTLSFRVTDPSDGTWRIVGWCSRHNAEGRAAFAAEQEMRKSRIIPEPDVNTGGLLPCYFRWDWESCYAQAMHGWKPPRLGIRADGWPVMAKAVPAPPPRLSLIRGDGKDELPGRPDDAVPLALVSTDG